MPIPSKQRPPRARTASAFALTLALAATGCSGTRTTEDLHAARLGLDQNDVDGMPPFPEDAVTGYMQKVIDGQVVGIRTLEKPASAPDDLDDYMETGRPDSNGYVYYDMNGAQSEDGVAVFRFNYVGRAMYQTEEHVTEPNPKPTPPAAPVLAADLQGAIEAAPDAAFQVHVQVKGILTTKLGVRPKIGIPALDPPDEDGRRAARLAKVQARLAESSSLVAATVAQIENLGGVVQHTYFTSPSLLATMTGSMIAELAQFQDVLTISLPQSDYIPDGTWGGAEEKSTGGLNGKVYSDNGYDGTGYWLQAGGTAMQIASAGDRIVKTHKAFNRNSIPTSSRLFPYDCTSCPFGVCACSWDSSSWPNTDTNCQHDLRVEGYATASLHNGQISGLSDPDKDNYSGVAEGPWTLYHWVTDSDQHLAAIENAALNNVDVYHISRGTGPSNACDGVPSTSAIGSAIFAAQQNEMIFVIGAGDAGPSGSCTVSGMAESPCALVVGELGSGCDDTNYGTSSCGIASESGRGGMVGTTNGFSPATLSLISLMVPGYMSYCLDKSSDSGRSTTCGHGSSFANPQVAGAGIMVKDYMLANGFTAVADEGRLSVILQAMGDRATSSSTYSDSGFDSLWGGGRFQMRNLANLGGPWWWGTSAHTMTNGQTLPLNVNGDGAEPPDLGQFKAYAMVFEEENLDMSQFYYEIFPENCSTGYFPLKGDYSTDVHHMVRVDQAHGASVKLCTKLTAHYVPSGESRKIHTFRYYSGPTSMR